MISEAFIFSLNAVLIDLVVIVIVGAALALGIDDSLEE